MHLPRQKQHVIRVGAASSIGSRGREFAVDLPCVGLYSSALLVQSDGTSKGVPQLALCSCLPLLAEAWLRVGFCITLQVAFVAALWPGGFEQPGTSMLDILSWAVLAVWSSCDPHPGCGQSLMIIMVACRFVLVATRRVMDVIQSVMFVGLA